MTLLTLELQTPQSLRRSSDCRDPGDYSDELDSIVSVLSDLCDVLADNPDVRFVVHGFDEKNWNATVRTDLAVALEQIPQAIENLVAKESAHIHFYEQGLERKLHFEGVGSDLLITCMSRHPSWRPTAQSIQMSRDEVIAMLRQLAESFLSAANKVCPKLAAHPWLRTWASACLGDHPSR